MANIGVTAAVFYEVGSSFVAIPNVISVNIPSPELSEINTTNLSNTGNSNSSCGGMLDPKECEVECHWTPSLWQTLDTMQVSHAGCGALTHWKVTAPTGATGTYTFDGWIKGKVSEFKAADLVVIKLSIRVSGVVTVA